MIEFFYIVFGILILYFLLLAWSALGFTFTRTFKAKTKNLQVPISIIICARNEEKNIDLCLNTLINQKYVLHKIQLIFINDASSDSTVQRAERILKKSGVNYKVISNPVQKGKKQSITYAMQFVSNELILVRDADTFTISSHYLQTLSDFYQQYMCDLIIAPIAIATNHGLLWSLQAMENNILAVITAGSAYFKKPFLCNGANLIFTKSLFEKVGGYASHINIASGDDVFFLEDAKRVHANIHYLKSTDAIVYTYPLFSFSSVLNQKVRWSSKFKQNTNTLNRGFAIVVFLSNFSWLMCLGLLSFPPFRLNCMLFISLKVIIDILLLFLSFGFIKNKRLLWYSLPVAFIYPLYAFVVGISSFSVKPKWK